jgi:hypothetical protein
MAAAHVVPLAALISTTWTGERMGFDGMRTTAFVFFEILSVAPPGSAVSPTHMSRPLWVRRCDGSVEREYEDRLEHLDTTFNFYVLRYFIQLYPYIYGLKNVKTFVWTGENKKKT